MQHVVKTGATSVKLRVFIKDSSSTTGGALTGLVFNTASLTAYYIKENASSATSMTLVTATVGTWTSLGFKEVDATNMPGIYEIGIPNAALDTAGQTVIYLKGAANMVPTAIAIQVQALDPGTAMITAPANFSSQVIDAAGNVTTIVTTIRAGTAQAGAAGSITLDSGASATDSLYVGALVTITSATGAGQTRLITGYTGSTKVATVSPNWQTNPDSTSKFAVLPFARVAVDSNNDKTGYTLSNAGIDGILTRGISSSEGSATTACLHWAISALAQKSALSSITTTSATLTVYKNDGSTALFAKTLTLAAGTNPISAQTAGA